IKCAGWLSRNLRSGRVLAGKILDSSMVGCVEMIESALVDVHDFVFQVAHDERIAVSNMTYAGQWQHEYFAQVDNLLVHGGGCSKAQLVIVTARQYHVLYLL